MDAIILERAPCRRPIPTVASATNRGEIVTRPTLDCRGSLAVEFQRACRRYANRAAVVEGDRSFCYRGLLGAAHAVRHDLQSRLRLTPGTPVSLLLDNSPEYLAAFYGVLLAGGVVVPLPAHIEAPRFEQIRRSSGSTIVITRAQELAGRSDLTLNSRTPLRLTTRDPAKALPTSDGGRGGDDLAMVAYTSGSTGLPKGVMLSHRNLLANTRSILEFLPIREDDRALVILPFCLAFGNSILQTHVLAGATLVVGGSPTFPVSIVEGLRDHNATSL